MLFVSLMGRYTLNLFTITCILLLSLLSGCEKAGKSREDMKIADNAISDSLKAGNLSGASRLVREGLETASDSDEYYNYMTHLAVISYYSAQPDSILAATSRVIAYTERNPETPARLKLRSKVEQTAAGYYNQYNYKADSALRHQKLGYEYALRSGDMTDTQLALANLADCYRLRGELDKAADTYRESISMGDSLRLDPYGMLPVYSGLAAVYTALHDFDQSKIWWDRTGRLWNQMIPNDRFLYLNNRGNDYYLAGDYVNALKIFLRLEKMLSESPEMEWEMHFCKANLSDVYIKLGRGDEADAYIEENLHYFSEVQPNSYAYNHVLGQKMRNLQNRGRYQDVMTLIRTNPVDVSLRSDQYLDRLEFLKDFYPANNMWQRAYKALEDYHAMEDSIRNDRVRLSAAEQELRYRRDSKVLSLQLDLDRNRHHLLVTYMVVGGVVLAMLILVLVIIMIRRGARAREARMLHKVMRLRLEGIRNRVTPHFIYNALNYELSARQHGLPGNLDSLVDLLRRQQLMADELTSSLADELTFADDYVAVESVNLNTGVDYEKTIDPDIDTAAVRLPSMSLQIFVENAFKHGFRNLSEGEKGLLRVEVSKTTDAVQVQVFNNAPASQPAAGKSTRVGMRVVMTTMQLLNEKNKSKMTVGMQPWPEAPGGSGYVVTMNIPDNFNFDIDANDN